MTTASAASNSSSTGMDQLQQLVASWEGVTGALNSFTDTVNRLAAAVPLPLLPVAGPVLALVRVNLSMVGDALSGIWDWLQKYVLSGFIGPWTMYDRSEQWATEVTRHVSDAEGRVSAQQLTGDDYWWGPAGKAYGDTITQQRQSAAQLADIARGIRETLATLGTTLKWLYGGVVAVIVLLVLEYTGAAAAALTFIGLPPAAVTFLTSTLTAAFVLSILAGFIWQAFLDAGSKFSTLLELLNDYDNFPAGHWPTLPGSMKDVSALDGSPQNWQIR
jgi:uncharacterized protein YukE